MKLQVLLRKIHHWGSIVIAIPLLVMIGAGVLLQMKKTGRLDSAPDNEWLTA